MRLRFNPLRNMVLLVVLGTGYLYLLQAIKMRQMAGRVTPAQVFGAAHIRGQLTYKKLVQGTQVIRVNNDAVLYEFRPAISAEGRLFQADADIGDTIMKLPGANSLLVKGRQGVISFPLLP